MNSNLKGELFPPHLLEEIQNKFYFVNTDPNIGKRIFFENSGGSFRLKSVVEADSKCAAVPDCPERQHETSLKLKKIQNEGIEDVRKLLNAKDGSILATYTASIAMFNIVRAIAENVPGSNIVTTCLEHPSSFDACQYYAEKTGKELRVATANQVTGGIDVETITSLVDEDTCLLSVMYASNLTGATMDIEAIVKAARKIKPDLYIVVDAVQHAAHGLIDLQKTPIDGINVAPYKFFGNRGVAFAYISDRASELPHDKLIGRDKNMWELGSPTPSDYATFTEIVNYICWIGKQFNSDLEDRRDALVEGMLRIKKHEQALLERLLNGTEALPGLRKIDGVNVHFDYENLSKRELIVAISFDDFDCNTATLKYRGKGIIVYERLASSIYSKRMLEPFKLDGVVRVSPLHCHSIEDIDKFIQATMEIISENK